MVVSTALLKLQRAVFVKAMPLRQHGATALQCQTVAAEIERRMPLLLAQHAGLLPPTRSDPACARAPVHLERGCLALAAWQSIADSNCLGLSASTSLRAQCVGAGFGVNLDDDGAMSRVASAGISERVIEAAGRFGSRFARDQQRFTASMVANFQSDLGRGFEFEALEPAPNFRMTKCMYRDIMHAGGAPVCAIQTNVQNASFLSFPYVCPEPVLVNRSFLV
jgi:hypothetical protein